MVAFGNSGRNPGQGKIAQVRQLQLLGGTAQRGRVAELRKTLAGIGSAEAKKLDGQESVNRWLETLWLYRELHDRDTAVACAREACRVSLADALGTQSWHSAEFMTDPACRKGEIGGQYTKTMAV